MRKVSIRSTFFVVPLLMCIASLETLRAQNPVPNDLILEGLNGPVKRIDEETATIVTKKGVAKESGRHRTRSMSFDNLGRMTSEWLAIADLPPFQQTYDYDKQGNQLRRTSRQGEPVGATSMQISLKTYRYDPAKRILFIDEYRGDHVDKNTLRQQYEYYFDESGRITRHVMRDKTGAEIFRRDYTYDAGATINEERLSMAENPVGQIFTYENTVDAHGNWIIRQSHMIILKSGEKQNTVIYRKISYGK